MCIRDRRIADTITGHAAGVLRDAEDRTRDLRWQQQQLDSFMTEMNELLRAVPRGARTGLDLGADDADTPSDEEQAPPPETDQETTVVTEADSDTHHDRG